MYPFKNLKVSRLEVKRPKYPRQSRDKGNLIMIVHFTNGAEWVPSYKEMALINDRMERVRLHNSKYDKGGVTYIQEKKAINSK